MLFRPMTMKKRTIILIIVITAIIMLTVWAAKCYGVNAMAYRSDVEIFQSGEFVSLDGNFMLSNNEKTAGYSVRVDGISLVDYTELMATYGNPITESSLYTTPKYCILLDITVKNEGNDTGYIHCYGLNLYDGALRIPVDFEIWNMIDENINGNAVLKLRKDSEVSLTIPYTAQQLDEAMNRSELNRRLEEETLRLCISEFPTIKLIEAKVINNS